jgi:CRISPR-associated Csx2 family protein
MAKILITSVGTGDIKKDSDSDYIETIYKIDNKEYKNTLASQVIVKHFDIDKIYFIGTSGSMWDNLYYKYNGEDDSYMDYLTNKKKNNLEHEDLEKFEKTTDIYLEQNGSKCFLINYDKNDSDEIWSNFERLLEIKEYIADGDEIYLDITHGFRYMPIINIFLLEFLTLVHKSDFKIKAILYGMFAGNKSEIIDFKIFFDLLEWIKAINEFKNYSNAWNLSQLLKDNDKDASKIFAQFSKNLQLANMHSLWQFMRGASKKINRLKNSHNKIIKLLSNEIEEIAKRFDKEKQSDFQYELAIWLYESKNYALSYIALYEAIISKVCETKGYDINEHKQREEAKKRVNFPYNKLFNTQTNKKDNLNSISQIRNSIVHQDNKRKDVVDQDINRLKTFLDEFKSFFK